MNKPAALGPVEWRTEVSRERYDAVFFDMGYTLVHFEPPQETVIQEALRAIGAERTVTEIRAAVTEVWGEFYRDAATATFPATPEHDRASQRRLSQTLLAHLSMEPSDHALQIYSAAVEVGFGRPGVIRPYPEVMAVLQVLKSRGYRLGIVSNWSWNLRERVPEAGLAGCFEVVWASAYAGCNKPHPAIFRQALVQLPPPTVAPDRVLYAGDSYLHDVIGARSAGLDAVLLDRNEAEDPVDCPVIKDLWGLLSLLRL